MKKKKNSGSKNKKSGSEGENPQKKDKSSANLSRKELSHTPDESTPKSTAPSH